MFKRLSIIGTSALLVAAASACQPSPPPPVTAPVVGRLTYTATLERDMEMGRTVTETAFRGDPLCDVRVVERRLKTEYLPVTGPMRTWNFQDQHVLRTGSEIKFTILNTPGCRGDNALVSYRGRTTTGPAVWLDVPYDQGYDEMINYTVSFYDGLKVIK